MSLTSTKSLHARTEVTLNTSLQPHLQHASPPSLSTLSVSSISYSGFPENVTYYVSQVFLSQLIAL